MEMLMPTTVTGINVHHAAIAPPVQPSTPASSPIDFDNRFDGEDQSNEISDTEEVRSLILMSSNIFIHKLFSL